MNSNRLEYDSEEAEKTASILERLADAAQKAEKALTDLEGRCHGGITIQMVGDICRVDIAPVSEE